MELRGAQGGDVYYERGRKPKESIIKYEATRSEGDYRRKVLLARLCAESSLVVRDACGTLVPKVAVCDHFYGTNKSRWLGALLAVAQSSNRHLSSNERQAHGKGARADSLWGGCECIPLL